MAYISVDYTKLESAAESVDSCVTELKSGASGADQAVCDLMLSWQGDDATEFLKKWKEAIGDNSVYSKMVSALESYSGYLSYAASKYKEAQAAAVNRADSLPKY